MAFGLFNWMAPDSLEPASEQKSVSGTVAYVRQRQREQILEIKLRGLFEQSRAFRGLVAHFDRSLVNGEPILWEAVYALVSALPWPKSTYGWLDNIGKRVDSALSTRFDFISEKYADFPGRE